MAKRLSVRLNTIYENESLIIQQIYRNLWINGVEARLSPKEIKLFDYLVKNSNRTVSQQELKKYLYPTGKKVDLKIIAILIAKIRRKIGHAAELLETTHGLGYRWSKPKSTDY